MESVGSHLRATRLNLGLSLEQISRTTRLSTMSLQAIEADNVASFPSPFFYRSYVRQFAAELQVDYSLLSAAVQRAACAIPEPLMPGQGTVETLPRNGPKITPLKVSRPRNLRWVYSLVAFVVTLTACSSFYGAWQQSRSMGRSTLTTILSFLIPSGHDRSAASVHQNVAQLAPVIPEPSAEPADTNTAPAQNGPADAAGNAKLADCPDSTPVRGIQGASGASAKTNTNCSQQPAAR